MGDDDDDGGVDGWAMMQQGLPEEEPKCAASILPAPTTSSALSYSRRLQAFSQPVRPTWVDQLFSDQLGLTNFFPTTCSRAAPP